MDAHALLMAGCSSNQQLSQPSPTVNTREAQMLIQEMWGSQYLSSSKKLQEESKGNICDIISLYQPPPPPTWDNGGELRPHSSSNLSYFR